MAFNIDKVSWHTQKKGTITPRDQTILRFWSLTNFLQAHQLTVRMLASSPDEIDDEYAINSDDLTELGLAVLKKAYDPWLKKIDKGNSPSDVSLLEKALKKLQAERS